MKEMQALQKALAFGRILSPKDIELALGEYETRALRSGDFFLTMGQTAKEIAFVSEGILRTYSLDFDGREVTQYFIRSHQFAVNLESYYSNLPSDKAMQAVADTTLHVIQREALDRLTTSLPNFYIFSKKISEMQLLNKLKDNDFLNYGTAKEKYLTFLQRYPELALRVPQQYIASYLKITPQSLSRIRKGIVDG
jgi:CRP-like cAMP-binding protein